MIVSLKRAAKEPERTAKIDRRSLVLLLALSGLLYAPALGGKFIWDDHLMMNGSIIGGGKSFSACFTQPFLYHFYRPLVSASIYLEKMIWGYHPAGYHATNILLHLATVWLLTDLMMRITRNRRIALLSGFLYSVHPVHVGAVAWIGGRTDSLCGFFLLAAFWLLQCSVGQEKPNLKLAALSALLFFLAVMTKEQALLLALLAPIAAASWSPARYRIKTALTAGTAWITAAALFVFIATRVVFPHPSQIKFTHGEIADHFAQTTAYYGLLLGAPQSDLMHMMSLNRMAEGGGVILLIGWAVAALAVVGSLVLLLWKPDRVWMALWPVLTLLPVSNLIPLPFLLASPYRAAISQAGIAALLGWALGGRLWEKLPALAMTGCGCLMLWHGSLTAWGTIQWTNEDLIFRRMLSADPHGVAIRHVYGYYLQNMKRYEDAVKNQEMVLTDVFYGNGWKDRYTAQRLVSQDPRITRMTLQNQGNDDPPKIWLSILFNQVGISLNELGRNEEAELRFQTGVDLYPENEIGNNWLSFFSLQRGDLQATEYRARQTARWWPKSGDAHRYLGICMTRRNRLSEGIAELRMAVQLQPESIDSALALQEALKLQQSASLSDERQTK